MKNATAKKNTARKKTAIQAGNATVAMRTSATQIRPLQEQPQSKEQAATQAGVFLSSDDQWSRAYFNPDDLHYAERELFG
jgi:hypothetical protein